MVKPRRRTSARHRTKPESDDEAGELIFDLIRKRKQPDEPFKTLRPRKTRRLNEETDDDQTIDQEAEADKEARAKVGKLRSSGSTQSQRMDFGESEARRLSSKQRRSAVPAMDGAESNSEGTDDESDEKSLESSLSNSQDKIKTPRRLRKKPRRRPMRRSSWRGSGSSRNLKDESTDTDEAPSDSEHQNLYDSDGSSLRHDEESSSQPQPEKADETMAQTAKPDDGTEEKFYDAVEDEASLLDSRKNAALSSNSQVPESSGTDSATDASHGSPLEQQVDHVYDARRNRLPKGGSSTEQGEAREDEAAKLKPPAIEIEKQNTANDEGTQTILVAQVNSESSADSNGMVTTEIKTEQVVADTATDDPSPDPPQNPTEKNVSNSSRNDELDQPGAAMVMEKDVVEVAEAPEALQIITESAKAHPPTNEKPEMVVNKAVVVIPETYPDPTEDKQTNAPRNDGGDESTFVIHKTIGEAADIPETSQKPQADAIANLSKSNDGDAPATMVTAVDEAEDIPEASRHPTEGTRISPFGKDDGNQSATKTNACSNDDGNNPSVAIGKTVDEDADIPETCLNPSQGTKANSISSYDGDQSAKIIGETVDEAVGSRQNPTEDIEANSSRNDQPEHAAITIDKSVKEADAPQPCKIPTEATKVNCIRNNEAKRPTDKDAVDKDVTEIDAVAKSNQDSAESPKTKPSTSDDFERTSMDSEKTVPKAVMEDKATPETAIKEEPNEVVQTSLVAEKVTEVESTDKKDEVKDKGIAKPEKTLETIITNNVDEKSGRNEKIEIMGARDQAPTESKSGVSFIGNVQHNSICQPSFGLPDLIPHSRASAGEDKSSKDISAVNADAVNVTTNVGGQDSDDDSMDIEENGSANHEKSSVAIEEKATNPNQSVVCANSIQGKPEPALANVQNAERNTTMVELKEATLMTHNETTEQSVNFVAGSSTPGQRQREPNQGSERKYLGDTQTSLENSAHQQNIVLKRDLQGVAVSTQNDQSSNAISEEKDNGALPKKAHGREKVAIADTEKFDGEKVNKISENSSCLINETERKFQKESELNHPQEMHKLRTDDATVLLQDKNDNADVVHTAATVADLSNSNSSSQNDNREKNQDNVKEPTDSAATKIPTPEIQPTQFTPAAHMLDSNPPARPEHQRKEPEIMSVIDVGNSQPQDNYGQKQVKVESAVKNSDSASRPTKRTREGVLNESPTSKRMCSIVSKPPQNLLAGSTGSWNPRLSQLSYRKRHTQKKVTTSKRLDLERVKIALYERGKRTHKEQHYNLLFLQYQRAISLTLSGSLSSKEIGKQRKIIKNFLSTKKLRVLHNKLVIGLLERCSSREIIGSDIPQNTPSHIRTSIKPQFCRETLEKNRVALTPRAMVSCSSVADESPVIKQKRPILNPFTSSRIPGALLVDPYVRVLAQSQGMRINEDAVWLVVVAVKEFASSLLSDCIDAAKSTESNRAPTNTRELPQILSQTASKEEESRINDKAETENSLTKRQATKQITSLDVLAVVSRIPISARSLSGCLSRVNYERTVRACHFGRPVESFESVALDDVRVFCFSKIAPPPQAPKIVVQPHANKAKDETALTKTKTDTIQHGRSLQTEANQKVESSKPLGKSSKDLSALVATTSASRPEAATINVDRQVPDNAATGTSSITTSRGSGTGTKNLTAMIARSTKDSSRFESTEKLSSKESGEKAHPHLTPSTGEITSSATKEKLQTASSENKGTAVQPTEKDPNIELSQENASPSQVGDAPIQKPAQDIANATNPSQGAAMSSDNTASHLDSLSTGADSANRALAPKTQRPAHSEIDNPALKNTSATVASMEKQKEDSTQPKDSPAATPENGTSSGNNA